MRGNFGANFLTDMLDFIVMQTSRVNREKGYWYHSALKYQNAYFKLDNYDGFFWLDIQ